MTYRYYLTHQPVGPGTFPGRPLNTVNFDCQEDVPGIGPAWGYLEYQEPLDDDAIKNYELLPAELKKFLIEVTSVHTLEVEAENEDKAIEQACGMAWEYDADEISGKVLNEMSKDSKKPCDAGISSCSTCFIDGNCPRQAAGVVGAMEG